MGEDDNVVSSTQPTDHGGGVENYECDGCRMDTTFTSFNCGVCPRNGERVREYNRKYVY